MAGALVSEPTLAEDKQLHVRVAEAIGCKLLLQEQVPNSLPSYWRCGCRDEFQAHGSLWGIWRYDTDWAVTGPLIERFGLCIEEPRHRGGWRARYQEIGQFTCVAAADTPLESVCRLILALSEAGKLPSA